MSYSSDSESSSLTSTSSRRALCNCIIEPRGHPVPLPPRPWQYAASVARGLRYDGRIFVTNDASALLLDCVLHRECSCIPIRRMHCSTVRSIERCIPSAAILASIPIPFRFDPRRCRRSPQNHPIAYPDRSLTCEGPCRLRPYSLPQE